MQTASEEEEREENEEEEEEEEEEGKDPRSSDEEGGLSLVAMTTEPELIKKTTEEDAEIQTASEQESHGSKGVCAYERMRACMCRTRTLFEAKKVAGSATYKQSNTV